MKNFIAVTDNDLSALDDTDLNSDSTPHTEDTLDITLSKMPVEKNVESGFNSNFILDRTNRKLLYENTIEFRSNRTTPIKTKGQLKQMFLESNDGHESHETITPQKFHGNAIETSAKLVHYSTPTSSDSLRMENLIQTTTEEGCYALKREFIIYYTANQFVTFIYIFYLCMFH